ncbi:haloacid dehalogenase superfamily protein [Spatholobus suberectus]|nr:haloacid dehalogenase superfamily protein [Spatholobus suberectus]
MHFLMHFLGVSSSLICRTYRTRSCNSSFISRLHLSKSVFKTASYSVRKLETSFVSYWSRRGLKPLAQKLLPDPKPCVKEP